MNALHARFEELRWIERRTGCVLTRNARAIKAVDGQGYIRGMVAFDDWTENSAQCHIAMDTAMAGRCLLVPAFYYVFQQAMRGVARAIIRGSNKRSLRLAKHLKFTEKYRVRDGWAPGEDLVCLEMRKEECPWLKAESEAA